MSTLNKLALLTCLYFAQGLPYGFFTQALPVVLRKEGVSLEAIGLSSLLALPWAIKFAWAPVLDTVGQGSRFGHRRSWLLPLQLVSALALVLLAFTDIKSGLTIVLAAVLVTNLLAATQDIATDGLAVKLLSSRERGLGNGVQVAGYRAGMIMGGGVLLVVFHRLGWSLTMLAMAAAMILVTIPVLLMREPPTQRDDGARTKLLDTLKSALARRGMARWLLAIGFYKFGDTLGSGMVRPMLVDLGFEMDDIGWMLGWVGFSAGLVGALAGGGLVNWLGRRRGMVIFSVAQIVALALYILPARGVDSMVSLYAICTADFFAGGMATAALFTLMMDVCDQRSAATDYTVQASAVVLVTGLAAALSGFSATAFDYWGHFVFSTLLSILGLMILIWTLDGSYQTLKEAGTSD